MYLVCMDILTPAWSLPGLWTTSMTTHLTGPCWSRKQHSKRPPQGDRGNRHKPPQASKLTNPRVTWKVSSKQPSDVFSTKRRHQLLTFVKAIVDLEHLLPKRFMKCKETVLVQGCTPVQKKKIDIFNWYVFQKQRRPWKIWLLTLYQKMSILLWDEGLAL